MLRRQSKCSCLSAISQRLISVVVVIICATTTQAASREIPLSEIYSTIRQEGLQYVSSGRRIVDGTTIEEDYARAMDELKRDRGGTSNVFLVDAATISDAVHAAVNAIARYHSAERPVRLRTEAGNNWLVAYLGCGHSSPKKWIVESVAINSNTIRLNYRKPKVRMKTADVVFYYYLVPIGALDNGAYNLELYDTSLEAVTLMRRVEVQ